MSKIFKEVTARLNKVIASPSESEDMIKIEKGALKAKGWWIVEKRTEIWAGPFKTEDEAKTFAHNRVPKNCKIKYGEGTAGGYDFKELPIPSGS